MGSGGGGCSGDVGPVLFLGEESWLLVPFEGVDGPLSAESNTESFEEFQGSGFSSY